MRTTSEIKETRDSKDTTRFIDKANENAYHDDSKCQTLTSARNLQGDHKTGRFASKTAVRREYD